MKIRDMEPGQLGKVSGYAKSEGCYRHKLLRMGLVKGAEFRLLRRAPAGDPVELELRGFNLTLRKTEADVLEVEVM
jgi:Fe2+ transport system protein FeoA